VNNGLVVKRDLNKARRDLDDGAEQMPTYWTCPDDRDAIGRVAGAVEALMRAISSVSIAVERLAAASAVPD
jgi:hypothetical protein